VKLIAVLRDLDLFIQGRSDLCDEIAFICDVLSTCNDFEIA